MADTTNTDAVTDTSKVRETLQARLQEDLVFRMELAAHARKKGTLCGRCGRPFAPGDPRYGDKVKDLEFIGSVPTCWECAGERSRDEALAGLTDNHGDFVNPCIGCDAPLGWPVIRSREDDSWSDACSMRCYWRFRKRVERTAKGRGRRPRSVESQFCGQCGQHLPSGRDDRVYCSNACRVAHHRGKPPTKPEEGPDADVFARLVALHNARPR